MFVEHLRQYCGIFHNNKEVNERYFLLFVFHDVPGSHVVENGGSLLGKASMPFRPCIPKSEHEYAGKQQKIEELRQRS